MKKIISSLVLSGLFIVPLAAVLAQEAPPATAPEVVSSAADLLVLINNIGGWVFVILLAIAATFLIIAGIFFVTAAGNPEQVNKARQMLINALIGVGIALGAKGMVAVIASILGAGAAN